MKSSNTFNLDTGPIAVDVRSNEATLEQLPHDISQVWLQTEQAGADAQTIRERGTAIGMQCRCALISASINSLASKIPPELPAVLVKEGIWLPEQAFAWVLRMPEASQRSVALVALAPRLPERLLSDAIDVANAIGPASLPAYLPEASWQDASETAQLSLQAIFRVNALTGLVPHLREPLQEKALRQALTMVLAIGYLGDRAASLTQIAPYLSKPLMREALIMAQELPTSHPATYGNPHSKALLGLIPRLVELGYRAEALSLVHTIPSHCPEAAQALVEIARRLAPSERSALFAEALDAVKAVADPREQVLALSALALLHADGGNLKEAIATVSMIEEAGDRTWALARLSGYLSESLVREALDLTHTYGTQPGNLDQRAEALGCVIVRLAELGHVEEAVTYVHALEAEQIAVLTMLAPRLVALGYSELALSTVQALELKDDQLTLLAVLAQYLPEPLSSTAVGEARSLLRGAEDDGSRARSLVQLAALLPTQEQIPLISMALAIGKAREIAWEEESETWMDTLQNVAALAVALPNRSRNEIFAEVLAAVHRYADSSGEDWIREAWPQMQAEVLATVERKDKLS